MSEINNPFPTVTIRATWDAFNPTPESIELTVFLSGAVLFVRSLAGDATQDEFAAAEDPDLYAAQVRPIYPAVPCTLTVV